MAGIRGNTGWIMAQKQSGLGVPAAAVAPGAAAGAFKSPLVGGGIAPVRNVAQLAETDANRDQGISYVTTNEVQGSPELYCRDDVAGFWLKAALGADAATGTSPNFTHALTPANALPYLTCWRDVGDALFEQFQDCKVSSLVIAAQANSPLTITPTLLGRTSTRLTADPSGPPPTAPAIALDSSPVYNLNNATITLSGGITTLVGQFSLTIDNGVTSQYTDNVQPIDVVEGLRAVSLSFDLVFQNLNEYNSFFYGSTSGTVISNTIYTTSADFSFALGTNNSIDLSIPSLAYQTFPVDVNPAGNPIVVSVTAVAQRNASPVITATVKNQVQTY